MDKVEYECDDTDDPDRGVLRVIAADNHDWYVTVDYADPDLRCTIPPSVRFRTSGGDHPFAAILCLVILWDIGRGKLDSALERANALVHALGRDRDVENCWPEESECES